MPLIITLWWWCLCGWNCRNIHIRDHNHSGDNGSCKLYRWCIWKDSRGCTLSWGTGTSRITVFGMRFIMPTLADKYLYKGLSGETYPDRKAGAKEGIYEMKTWVLHNILFRRNVVWEWIQSGLRLQDIRLLITAGQTVHHRYCALKRMAKNLHFPVCLIQHLRLKMPFTRRTATGKKNRFMCIWCSKRCWRYWQLGNWCGRGISYQCRR